MVRYSKQQIIEDHPNPLGIEGWYYKLDELSNCYWRMKAMSLSGQSLIYDGTDEAELIERCRSEALKYK